MTLEAGARVGPYEILALLGRGGMGEVYRARDTKLNRDVAVKVLLPAVANDPDRLARFSREAQVLASLNHPNIAHIHGLEDGGPSSGPQGIRALVMELVEGPTLADRIALGRIPIAEVLPIARQIADALEAAHEQGIVHRDLKPANIKVRDDGTVKVLDFGLAKAMDSTPSGAANATMSPTMSLQATQAGIILGTAAYMAPEQAKGKAVDKRADIWAFGVVLFEMLTGRRGYQAEDAADTLAAVLTREVDWSALPATTPLPLRAVVRDCLVRDPKQRLRDIGEARRVLDRLMTGAPAGDDVATPVAVARSSPTWRRAVPWAISSLAVAVAAAAVWVPRGQAPSRPRTVTRSKVELKDFSGLVDLSRDGTKLAYTTAGPQGFYLTLRQLDQFEARPVPGSNGGQTSIFSPDGAWIAFTAVDVQPPILKKIPVGGGTPITLCPGSFNNGAAWGEDDTVVFTGPKGLLRVPASGGSPQSLTTVDASKKERSHVRPQFLPGGDLLFTVVSESPGSQQFALLDLRKGQYRILAKGGDNGRYSPSGHLTFVRDGTLFAVPFDLAHLSVIGAEVPVIEKVSSLGPPGTADYAFSETGVLVYAEAVGGQGTIVALADRTGAVRDLPGQVPRMWGTGRLSPDGLRLANTITDGENEDLWVVDLARGTPTRLTFGGRHSNPIWSPDGRRIVYASRKDGKSGLSSVASDGSGQPELILFTDVPAAPASFTPDGQTLLYSQAAPGGRPRTMVLPPAAAGGARTPRPLREGEGGERQSQVSPDGKWVAFASNESGTSEVYVLPFPGPGGKVRISTQGGLAPRWSRSGRELFFWTNAGASNATLMAVRIQTAPSLVADAPRELFKMFQGTTWDVTPDGDHFLVESPRATGISSAFATVTDWFEELRRRAPAKK